MENKVMHPAPEAGKKPHEGKGKTLRDRAKEFDSSLPFMDQREKGVTDELLGQITTIEDYGFLPGAEGEVYAVFTVAERSNKFYFAGSVLTDRLSKLDAEGYRDQILDEGLPMLMTEAKSRKTGRTYVNVVFYPEG